MLSMLLMISFPLPLAEEAAEKAPAVSLTEDESKLEVSVFAIFKQVRPAGAGAAAEALAGAGPAR